MEHVDAWTYVQGGHQLCQLALAAYGARPPDSGEDADGPGAFAAGGEAWEPVSRLPRRRRTTVDLRHVVDLPGEEIARVMKVSRGMVASTLADARRALGRALVDVDVPKRSEMASLQELGRRLVKEPPPRAVSAFK